eukprot:8130243-Alexandrium_andersonii.AAC.1
MSASLVGSEMCIRDRLRPQPRPAGRWRPTRLYPWGWLGQWLSEPMTPELYGCLLYTSDAADDMQ